MDLDQYQLEAQRTDKTAGVGEPASSVVIPLLGLAGEAGELLSEYKKHLRDGKSHQLFNDRIKEELGDLLWYVSSVAGKFGISLNEVAEFNIQKTRDRWLSQDSHRIFDAAFEEGERLPRRLLVEMKDIVCDGKPRLRMEFDGKQLGDDLTDNSDDPDGYRFHDIFHLSYVALLGWSPVLRKMLQRKRKSNPNIDEVQDGGRAQVIDEGVSALVFEYAKHRKWLEGVQEIDYQLLRTIKGLTSFLEVSERSAAEWQAAILSGFEVWREVLRHGGGLILVDQDARSIKFIRPSCGQASAGAVAATTSTAVT
jgi:NTP pyrophosphatase (non-canonical NTP hydrolase)